MRDPPAIGTRGLAAVAIVLALAGGASFAIAAPGTPAPRDAATLVPKQAAGQLSRALAEGREASRRAARLSREAEAAGEAADRSSRKAAALAARIQAAEADIAVAKARHALARGAADRLRARLAQRRQPLVRLTGALQTSARRPLILSALQPGSLQDLVHVRAVLAATVPQIRRRTAALRGRLDEGERLERRAAAALGDVRASQDRLQTRRTALAALEQRQRLASRSARGSAAREADRALVLGEQARDLDGLIARLDEAARLRRDLAALPGPVLRPADIGATIPVRGAPSDDDTSAAPGTRPTPPGRYQLPVQGRAIAGFGERRASGARASGLTLAPVAGAQVVAPAAGRIVFAGPYRGFDRIVIVEHDGGWTSLVTGLARTSVAVGDTVIAGAPIGTAERPGRTGVQPMTIELRRDGEPVNPLAFVR